MLTRNLNVNVVLRVQDFWFKLLESNEAFRNTGGIVLGQNHPLLFLLENQPSGNATSCINVMQNSFVFFRIGNVIWNFNYSTCNKRNVLRPHFHKILHTQMQFELGETMGKW